MGLVLTTPPTVEPVGISEAKAHLRISEATEDVLLSSLLLTSRLHIEAALSLALITQTWTLTLDRWPQGWREGQSMDLPIGPLQSVSAVRIRDRFGMAMTIAPTSYLVDIASRPARLIWNGGPRPDPGAAANGIEIELISGFGATPASVPAPLKHAILMLTAHWYEHRDPVEIGSDAARIPDAVSDLIQPFRKIRL